MSKLSFALSSLVAVLPAAFMMYLLVLGFIAGMPTMLMVMSGLAVICGVGIALLPILSFIIGPKTETAPAAAESEEQEEAVDDFEDFGEEAVEDDFEEMSSADEFDVADGADDWEDFDDSDFEEDED